MKGTERGPGGTLRYFYQYRADGTKYYYQKVDHGRLRQFRKPFIPKEPKGEGSQSRPPPEEYREYVPVGSKMEEQFRELNPNIRKLIETWMLVFGFNKVDDINCEEVTKAFRRLSLVHHPDKGGSLEKYQELSSVRDHLMTLCALAQAMK